MAPRLHDVRISPLPAWIDTARWLGPEAFTLVPLTSTTWAAEASLPAHAAAGLAARLRGLGLDGSPIQVEITPPLPRALVRACRLVEARAQRAADSSTTMRGTRLDAEARYSLTPEALALELGRRAGGVHVVDVCCGGGGNSIGFARAGCKVTAIEIDKARAADAKHNLALYGVGEHVQVLTGDARELLPGIRADLAFVDPPWGRDYEKSGLGLNQLPLLAELLPLCGRFARTWIKVPVSFASWQVPGARAEAIFATQAGNERRIKFVLLKLEPPGNTVPA